MVKLPQERRGCYWIDLIPTQTCVKSQLVTFRYGPSTRIIVCTGDVIQSPYYRKELCGNQSMNTFSTCLLENTTRQAIATMHYFVHINKVSDWNSSILNNSKSPTIYFSSSEESKLNLKFILFQVWAVLNTIPNHSRGKDKGHICVRRGITASCPAGTGWEVIMEASTITSFNILLNH